MTGGGATHVVRWFIRRHPSFPYVVDLVFTLTNTKSRTAGTRTVKTDTKQLARERSEQTYVGNIVMRDPPVHGLTLTLFPTPALAKQERPLCRGFCALPIK